MIGRFERYAIVRALVWLALAQLPVLSSAAHADCRQLGPQLRRQPTTEQWERIEGMAVVDWLTEIEGSPVKEGMAVGLVEAPPERVFRVVTDNARFAEFMPFVELSTVETLADGSLVNLQSLDLPWPVSNREYKIKLVNEADAGGEPPLWQSAWTHVKGFGNIEESRGAWRVFPCGERALVEYQVYTDPGGSIPTYFKNKATRRSLNQLIEAVRSRVGDPSYDAPG